MEISIQTPAHSADAPDKRLDRIMIDPITHLQLQITKREVGILSDAIMPPANDLIASSCDLVRAQAPPHHHEHLREFVGNRNRSTAPQSPLDYAFYPIGCVAVWPFSPIEDQDIDLIESIVPTRVLALCQHDDLLMADKHVGRIEELLVDPRLDAFTHLVLLEGHVTGQKRVSSALSP